MTLFVLVLYIYYENIMRIFLTVILNRYERKYDAIFVTKRILLKWYFTQWTLDIEDLQKRKKKIYIYISLYPKKKLVLRKNIRVIYFS